MKGWAKLSLASGVCSGPKGPVIDFPIFGFERGPPTLVDLEAASNREGLGKI